MVANEPSRRQWQDNVNRLEAVGRLLQKEEVSTQGYRYFQFGYPCIHAAKTQYDVMC